MVSEKLETKLNELLNGELEAHHIYLQAAAWASAMKFEGAKNFLLVHAAEELTHMLKFFTFLDDLGAPIALKALPKPVIDATTIKALFVRVQEEERKVSQHIFEAIDLARAEHSYETDQFLQWFAAEQHEEEKLCRQILDKIELIGEGPNSQYFVDKELGALAKVD
ncbi:ferritin [Aquabacter spiritensis]|uniref:Ferritin n=1 Tax=Aquabacter spiritensis TaxID=933073 RepID=A0A4R3M5C1_9HYPH|nr:ferritin-like domain-containing protein [Aquabacter spiritensis]TCT06637.1 ferritin [Aquabacter spiritensis]